MNSFDVCIVPFLLTEAILKAAPIKVYEYVASDKPVVATDMPAITEEGQLIYIGRNSAEFERKITEALQNDNNSLAKERRKFAERNSWDVRVEEILRLPEQQLGTNANNSLQEGCEVHS